MKANQKLIDHWKSRGVPIGKGALEGDLRRFEAEYSLVLPRDFRDYPATMNGMVQRGGADCDPDGFAFWPLGKIKPMPVMCAECGVSIPPVDKSELFFVFADYLQWSWAYAIRLGREGGTVISVGTGYADVVGSSFTAFVSLYVVSGDALFPKPAQRVP